MKKILSLFFILFLVCIFFWQFFMKGLLPIPSDTIVGLYYPFRDLYVKDYPNGIPFKNFLITDPVRQQYPWRELAISLEKKFQLPLWNPYNFSGTPLLANLQSAVFYPLNILFFALPFDLSWSLLILLGPLLGGVFLFLYLNNLKLSNWASLLGAMVFSFGGFSIAWLEWGTIVHVGLWLPLVLLSIDKLLIETKGKKAIIWFLVYTLSLLFSFFAGHLQVFFYLWIFSFIYLAARWWLYGRKVKTLIGFVLSYLIFIIFTLPQWLPTLQLISLSAREIDLMGINSPGWFIPWQNIIQFIAPDYFGNPTTLNYWGIWNYGEFIGYIGMAPLILALFAMFNRRDKKTFFFGIIFFISLFFAFPTFLAKIPYLLKIPFLSTAQPTRLLFVIDFVLAVLAGLGLDYLLKTRKKINIFYSMFFILIVIVAIWVFIPGEHFQVVRNNLILPTLLFTASLFIFTALIIFQNRKLFTLITCVVLVVLTGFDLLRFGWKFETFSQKSYLFPTTSTISYLQDNLGNYRLMATDDRILPPNFSSVYRLNSVDGYDPLYIQRYGELIVASERKKADTNPPFGFNRIITPHNYESKTIDLLGVKYILSLSNLNSPKVKKVFQEGKTIVYENLNVLPRVFFVQELEEVSGREDAIERMFESSFDPKASAIVEEADQKLRSINVFGVGKSHITSYSENNITIETENSRIGFLVLTDTFYPSWEAMIDGNITKIYRVDYNFRGVIVPAGKHKIEYRVNLF